LFSQQCGQQLGSFQAYNRQPESLQPYVPIGNQQQQLSGLNLFYVNYQPGNLARGTWSQFCPPIVYPILSETTSNYGPNNNGYVYQQPGPSNVGQTAGNTVYNSGPNQGYGYFSQPSQFQGPSGGPSAGYQGQVGPEQLRHIHGSGQTTGNGAGDGRYTGPGQSFVPAMQQLHVSVFKQQLPQAAVSNDAFIVNPPVLARGKSFQCLLLLIIFSYNFIQFILFHLIC